MYRQFINRRVLLIIDTGTIDGTLAAVHKDGLIMKRATFIAEDGESSRPLDGAVLVPIGSVEFGQVM